MTNHPLRTWRLLNKLTLAELATSVGVSNSALSLYERGKRMPRPATLRRIEEVTLKRVTSTHFVNNLSGGVDASPPVCPARAPDACGGPASAAVLDDAADAGMKRRENA